MQNNTHEYVCEITKEEEKEEGRGEQCVECSRVVRTHILNSMRRYIDACETQSTRGGVD